MTQPGFQTITLDREGVVATIELSRPAVHNAFNPLMIQELCQLLTQLEDDHEVRLIILSAQGESFCSGADLEWMRESADYSVEENQKDALVLGHLMKTLYQINKPTIARIGGSAYGGGIGLIACCDIAIASSSAHFALTEPRLGLVPGVISPYVVRAIGIRSARRYMLTGEKFDAATALQLGLIHQITEPDGLDQAVAYFASHLKRGGPNALSRTKELIALVDENPIDQNLISETADRIAHARVSQEGREGISSFFNRCRPSWADDEEADS